MSSTCEEAGKEEEVVKTDIVVDQPFFSGIDEFAGSTWTTTLDDYRMFLEKEERKPLTWSSTIREKKLALWYIKMRHYYRRCISGMKDSVNRGLWDELHVSFSRLLVDAVYMWKSQLDQYDLFVETTGRRPSYYSEDLKEKKLAIWQCQIERNFNRSKDVMDDKISRMLWLQSKNNSPQLILDTSIMWYTALEEFKLFVEENGGRRPTHRSKDSEEKTIARWSDRNDIDYVKSKGHMKDTVKRALWEQQTRKEQSVPVDTVEEEQEEEVAVQNVDELIFISAAEKSEKWKKLMEDYKLFLHEKEKKPTKNTTNMREEKLAEWYVYTTDHYARNIGRMKDATNRSLWEGMLSDYSHYVSNVSIDEKWQTNYERLRDLLRSAKSAINAASVDQEESALLKWFESTHRNYRNNKGQMKDTMKRDLWEQLSTSYSAFFEAFSCSTEPATSTETATEDKSNSSNKRKKPKTLPSYSTGEEGERDSGPGAETESHRTKHPRTLSKTFDDVQDILN